MKFIPPRVDYRKLRFNNLTTDFKYLWSLLYWIAFGIAFALIELLYPDPESCKYLMYCPFDDYIPFLEIFVIPYLMWFAFLVLTHLYTLLYDIELYKKLIKFIIITYTTATLIFLIFPNAFATPDGVSLRPDLNTFPRQNIFTDIMQWFYTTDTPTNVAPSLHVVGSFACMFTILHSPRLKNKIFRAIIIIITVLISISTVFLKQHSILDVVLAIPICVIAEIICFAPHLIPNPFKRKKPAVQTAKSEQHSPVIEEVAVTEQPAEQTTVVTAESIETAEQVELVEDPQTETQ